MSYPIIAAQLYTVRDFTKTPKDIEKTFKKLKEIGYNAVQVSGIGPIEHERLKHMADEAGLKICATHISFDKLEDDFADVVKQHKLWDCEYVGLGSMPGEYRTNEEGFKNFAHKASEIAGRLNDQGLKFVYHNHNFEFTRFGNITGMDILFNESDPDAFQFEMDTFWVQAGGANPVDWIKKLKGRMEVIHFKDMAVGLDMKPIMSEVGEGNLNWKDIIDACKDIGVKWAPVEQDICKRDPFESLSISLKNLKKMGLSSEVK